jgi:hypothetical protein
LEAGFNGYARYELQGRHLYDMSLHMNKLIDLNKPTKLSRARKPAYVGHQTGMLQNAVTKLGAKRNYTVGHFPQSIEFPALVAGCHRVAGQKSTYYEKTRT